jgi:hypothetical protein
MTLFAVIDHSGEAEASGLPLRDTKVVMSALRSRPSTP